MGVLSPSCVSQRLAWEEMALKITYHVKAKDCRMQKMSASPLLRHCKQNDTVRGVHVTTGNVRKGRGE